MAKTLEELVRNNIRVLKPYSSARDEYKGKEASVFLDANESPYNTPYNRYPDPLHMQLKEKIAAIQKVQAEQVFLGNGSDEAIDLVYRIFCEPRIDNVVAISPSYGMYEVCANINDVEYRTSRLTEQYLFSAEALLSKCDNNTKAIFLCSPNNPTGNCLDTDEIEKLLRSFDGIVVIDEAYADFSDKPSFLSRIEEFSNLIVLRTFSKAWGSAGVRLGMAFASVEIISIFNKVKYPYNINILTANYADQLLERVEDLVQWTQQVVRERSSLMSSFSKLPICKEVFPTDANFFLARVDNAGAIYYYLVSKGIIVRNRSKVELCNDCLRITVGLPSENSALIAALRNY